MPQPVPPPEPPAIFEPVVPETAQSQADSLKPMATLPSTQALPTGLLAAPTPPEAFAPEFVPTSTTPRAALLGPPIAVGRRNSTIFPTAQLNLSQVEPEQNLAPPIEPAEPARQQPEVSPTIDSVDPYKPEPEPEQNVSPTIDSVNYTATDTGALGEVAPTPDPAISPTVFPNSPHQEKSSEEAADVVAQAPVEPSSSRSKESNAQTQLAGAKVLSPLLGLNSNPSQIETLLTQERGGEVREFEFTIPENAPEPVVPSPSEETAPQVPSEPPPGNSQTAPSNTSISERVIELTADREEYDDQRKVITAEGNVVLRFQNAVLDADRLEVNLPNRIIVAQGNVALTRGEQVLRGERFEYFFVQDSGVILNASGEVYTPTAGEDFAFPSPTNVATPGAERPLSDRLTANQPLQRVTNTGGYSFVVGGADNVAGLPQAQTGGNVSRLRFEADRVEFEEDVAVAQNVRITNDPFSPPELELRADTATFRRISPLQDEIVATRPRLVFDQGLEVPLLRNRIGIDRRERQPAPISFGYDGGDLGGLFAERTFEIINRPNVRFSVTPQYLVQKAIFGDANFIEPSAFGLRSELEATLSPRTTVVGSAVLTSLDPTDFENQARASLRLQQIIGTALPHRLNLEYSYRDRLFNGSLGFQTVQSSLGAVLTSPIIPLGNSGFYLNYQAGAQYINADTDRIDILESDRKNNRVSLGRYQGTATLSRGFLLWQGEALPATPTEGLRYTPVPVQPYLRLNASTTGVGSLYSNGESQASLSGSIALQGQVGQFSKRYLDYTGFNLGYSHILVGNQSPFLFDRIVDTSVLFGGITQQIYGPFRAGFQTAISLDNNRQISTDYFVEYSRRTYNILLRYNPIQEIGSLSFRINDFNWAGNPGRFDGSGVRPVVQGVAQ
jgi:hypothetical protein